MMSTGDDNSEACVVAKVDEGRANDASAADEAEDCIAPDSWQGWVIVFGAFIVEFTVLGATNAFGSLFDEFQADETLGKPSAAKVSLVFSLSTGLLPVVGLAAGRFTDRYGPRVVQMFAGFMLGVGLLASSYCTNYWSLLVVFAITLGLASGCTIVPGLTAAGEWFDAKRPLAIGIVASGSGLGTTGVPLLGNLWVGAPSTTGENWRQVFRKLSLLAIPAILAGALTRRRRPYRPPTDDDEAAASRLSTKDILTNKLVVMLFLVGLLFGCGYFSLLVYIPHYAHSGGQAPYEDREKFTDLQCTVLLAVFGLAQSTGNVFWGDMGRRFGPRNMFRAVLVVNCVGFLTMPWCYNYALQTVFAVTQGFVVAGCLTSFPATAASYFAGPQLGSIISVAYLGFGAGGTVGPPVAGALLDGTGGRYLVMSLFGSVCFAAAFFVVHFLLPDPAVHAQRQKTVAEENARLLDAEA